MRQRPLGITVIAIVLILSGVFQIAVGADVLGYTKLGLAAAAEQAQVNGWAGIVSGLFSVVGGLGLFTLAGWAWLLAVLVLGVRVIGDLVLVATQGYTSTAGGGAVANLVISLVILWYFMRANVKAAFGR